MFWKRHYKPLITLPGAYSRESIPGSRMGTELAAAKTNCDNGAKCHEHLVLADTSTIKDIIIT